MVCIINSGSQVGTNFSRNEKLNKKCETFAVYWRDLCLFVLSYARLTHYKVVFFLVMNVFFNHSRGYEFQISEIM